MGGYEARIIADAITAGLKAIAKALILARSADADVAEEQLRRLETRL